MAIGIKNSPQLRNFISQQKRDARTHRKRFRLFIVISIVAIVAFFAGNISIMAQLLSNPGELDFDFSSVYSIYLTFIPLVGIVYLRVLFHRWHEELHSTYPDMFYENVLPSLLHYPTDMTKKEATMEMRSSRVLGASYIIHFHKSLIDTFVRHTPETTLEVRQLWQVEPGCHLSIITARHSHAEWSPVDYVVVELDVSSPRTFVSASKDCKLGQHIAAHKENLPALFEPIVAFEHPYFVEQYQGVLTLALELPLGENLQNLEEVELYVASMMDVVTFALSL